MKSINKLNSIKMTRFDNLGRVVNMTLTPDISLVHGSGFGS